MKNENNENNDGQRTVYVQAPAPQTAQQQVVVEAGYTFGKFCLHMFILFAVVPVVLLGGCVTCGVASIGASGISQGYEEAAAEAEAAEAAEGEVAE